MLLVVNWIIFVLPLGSKPDHSKTGGKKGLKVIQDPRYRRYSNKVDMDSALETFIPVRSEFPTLHYQLLVCRLFSSSKPSALLAFNCLTAFAPVSLHLSNLFCCFLYVAF